LIEIELGDAAKFTNFTVEAGLILFTFIVPEELDVTELQIKIKAEEVLDIYDNPIPVKIEQTIVLLFVLPMD
jgi:hypothetical protein